MIYNLEQCSSLVEKQLKKLAIGEKEPVNLYAPVTYALESGGKRIRPSLTLMACNLFSDDIEPALMPAVAIEIFHNFTLLHDDVMDRADVRRNRPTVHKRWSESTAILSGDAMLVLAYQYISQVRPEMQPLIWDVFSRTALEVCEGQQYDMDFEQRTDVSIDEYLKMIRLKTAVLLAASLKIGAICGGGDRHNSEALYRFGISLGLTFQIQDDWLDVYSDPKIFGKATGGDILSGKKTFLLLSALEKADHKTKEQLLTLLGRKDMQDEEKIEQVKQCYDRLDVNGMAQQKMEAYYQETMKHLEELQLPSESRKKELEKVAAALLKRNK